MTYWKPELLPVNSALEIIRGFFKDGESNLDAITMEDYNATTGAYGIDE